MAIEKLRQSLIDKLFVEEKYVVTFFLLFSRFEYALKRSGYHVVKGNGDVLPDWDKFARQNRLKIDENPSEDFINSKSYLLQNPTMKQVVEKGELSWKDSVKPADKSETEYALILVRRTRNNLFHGGKFHKPVAEPSRDSDLLNHCMVILQEVMKADSTVERHFNEVSY